MGGIDLSKYTKNYGYWHTEFGNRVQRMGLNPYRTISIEQLDLMLHSYDFSGHENERVLAKKKNKNAYMNIDKQELDHDD